MNLAEQPDGVHPKLEKYMLRKAFDLPDDPYLPDDVLFRQKEQVLAPPDRCRDAHPMWSRGQARLLLGLLLRAWTSVL